MSYQRLDPEDYTVNQSTNRKNSIHKKRYHTKIALNIFKVLSFLGNLIIVFSPRIWNKEWMLDFESNTLLNSYLCFISVGAVLLAVSVCGPTYVCFSSVLLIVDLAKLILFSYVGKIERQFYVSEKEDYDRFEIPGYIVMSILIVFDIFLIFGSYRLRSFYERSRYL